MPYPVRLSLYKNGYLLGESIAENPDDLYCRIEMDTGIGWLDTAGLYQKLLDKGGNHVTDTFRVCHSYEKWGDMQQEVVMIEVKMQRLDMTWFRHPFFLPVVAAVLGLCGILGLLV